MSMTTLAEEKGSAPMRASDVIKELQRLVCEHGDLPVTFDGSSDPEAKAGQICAYDAEGYELGPPVEFHIHSW